MKIFVDENIPIRTVEELRAVGLTFSTSEAPLIKEWMTTCFGRAFFKNIACSSQPTRVSLLFHLAIGFWCRLEFECRLIGSRSKWNCPDRIGIRQLAGLS